MNKTLMPEKIQQNPLQKTDRKINQLCYIFLIFMIGCIVGWIYEEIFYLIADGILCNRGVLYGPWLPIYGVGAICIYAMKPLKKHFLLLFVLCAVITGIVEYIIGIISVRFFDLRLWDYRGLFLNVNGLVCLRSVMSFAIMGVIFHYLIEPAAERAFRKTNTKIVYAVCIGLFVLMIIDCILSLLFRTPITY